MSYGQRQRLNLELCRNIDPIIFEGYRERFMSDVWPFLSAREGGFADQPTDSGGPTRYGVTWLTVIDLWQRFPAWCKAYRIPHITPATTKAQAHDIMKTELQLEQAQAIALIFYYVRTTIARLPAPWDVAVLDWRYNGDGGRSIKTLQELAGYTGRDVDGIVGPKTQWSVSQMDWEAFEFYMAARLEYLKGLMGSQGWEGNGRGWTNRLRHVKEYCRQHWPTDDCQEAAP